MSAMKEFTKGLWKENPVLILLLGLCPTLGVTSNATNGMGMGVATLFVLIGSNVVISLMKSVIPKKVRIPCYIVVIATFVTVVQLLMQAYLPDLNKSLGLFIPLIVVNCIVLGRAEAFASKNSVVNSIADALGMGIGFTLTLMALGGTREFLAHGKLFDLKVITPWTGEAFSLMTFAPGAFIVLGVFLAIMNKMEMRKAIKEGRIYTSPSSLNCASCRICKMDDID